MIRNLTTIIGLSLAVAAFGCGSTSDGTAGSGGSGTAGTGGSGTAGTGGSEPSVDACQGEADQGVYAGLSFTNDKGEATTGTEAASDIGSDCVRGSASSVPPIPAERGCGTILQGILGCALAMPPNCTEEQVSELATCVEDCTQETISEITDGGMLTQECIDCYGATVGCATALCARECANDASSAECIGCRCTQNCTSDFETCSGITSTDCD